MKTTHFLSALSTTILLASCGGGSGGDNPVETPQQVTPPAPQPNNTLEVTLVYQNSCNIESPITNGAILIHNQDFSVKEKVTLDSSGTTQVRSLNDSETITLVMNEQKQPSNADSLVILETYSNHPIKGNLTSKVTSSDRDGCDCATLAKVTFTKPLNFGETRPNYHFNAGFTYTDGYSFENNQAIFTNAVVCKAPQDDWPVVTYHEVYSSGEGYAGAIYEFNVEAESINVDMDIQGKLVDISSSDYKARTLSRINGREHFWFDNNQGHGYSYDIPNIEQIHEVHAYLESDITKPENTYSARTFSDSSYASTSAITEFSPLFDTAQPFDYSALVPIVVGEEQNWDLSQQGEFDLLEFYRYTMSEDKKPLYVWTYKADPQSGQLPSLEHIDLSEFISQERLDMPLIRTLHFVDVYDYSAIHGYNDYMSKMHELQADIKSRAADNWAKLNRYSLEILALDPQ